MTGLASPQLERLVVFWLLAILLVTTRRAVARTVAVARAATRGTVMVGAGDVGQLVARKLLQHPEYGLDLVGFVDADPLERRVERVTSTCSAASTRSESSSPSTCRSSHRRVLERAGRTRRWTRALAARSGRAW